MTLINIFLPNLYGYICNNLRNDLAYNPISKLLVPSKDKQLSQHDGLMLVNCSLKYSKINFRRHSVEYKYRSIALVIACL